MQRSAYTDAIEHLNEAVVLLQRLPDSSERRQQEVTLQLTLGASFGAAKGFASSEMEHTLQRAQSLCTRAEQLPQLSRALHGLRRLYMARGELQKSDEMADQHLQIAQQLDSPVVLLAAHAGRGITSYLRGDFLSARTHLDQTFALYDTRQHQALASLYGDDLSAASSGSHALVLWALGYPERALTQLQEKLLPADELPSLLSLGTAHMFATLFHQYRRERAMMLERAEALLALSQENGLPFYLTVGTICRGWASMEQGDGEAGIAQIREGLAMSEAAGTRNLGPYFRVW